MVVVVRFVNTFFFRAIRAARFQPSCHTFWHEVGLLTTPVRHKACILQELKMPHSGLKALSKSTPLTSTKRVSERTTIAIITVAVIFVTLANCDW
jgi:hypothetical protein